VTRPGGNGTRAGAPFFPARKCTSVGTFFGAGQRLYVCQPRHAVQIEPGLCTQSPRNGNFPNVRRRLSAISLPECPKWGSGDWPLTCESPPLAGLCASIGALSLSAGLLGWGCSADRTRLQANSLLTGNFTGKFAIFGFADCISCPETAAPQPLLRKFPSQANREVFRGNRELSRENREFMRDFPNAMP
jgi:hypothetical protein